MLKYLFKSPKPSETKYEFKLMHSFEKRKKESEFVINKYNDRIPVIVEKSDSSKVVDIDKHKYLIPKDLSAGQFMYLIRKRIKINSVDALFIFVNNETIPLMNQSMGELYEQSADKDGFLYISYASENTFGYTLKSY